MGILQHTAVLLGGSGRWNSCTTTTFFGGSWQWVSCGTLPDCLGALSSGSSAIHRHIALGPWAVEFRRHIPKLPEGSEPWNCCNTPPHRLGR